MNAEDRVHHFVPVHGIGRITVLILRSGRRAVEKDALACFDLIGLDALKLHVVPRRIGSCP